MIMVKNLSNIAQSEAFMATSWLLPNGFVEAIFWTFDGNFQKNTTVVQIKNPPSPDAPFKITELAVYPMSYVEADVQNAIRARGEMFWKCRRQHYVCYGDRSVDGIQNTVRLIYHALTTARENVELTRLLV